MSDHFTGSAETDSNDEEAPESAGELQISDLPRESGSRKWRLLDSIRDVSRATFQDVAPGDEVDQDADFAEETGSEKLDIEISDLPPTRRSHYLLLKLIQLRALLAGFKWISTPKSAPLSGHQRRAQTRRTIATLGICAALVVLLIGNLPGMSTRLVSLLQHQPAPAATANADLTTGDMPIVINHFGNGPVYPSQSAPGPLPSTCPQISTLQYFTTPLDPPGLGASPIWLSGFTGPSAALNHLVPINAQVAHAPWPGGWYQSVAVFIQKSYPGNITLRGSGQKNSSPVWLSRDNPHILSTALTLNLKDGSRFLTNGQWEMTSITIAVPTSGCYALQATWSNSSWTRFFAAGS
jgi:hypothetical protein